MRRYMNYQEFIIRDPKICGGEPVIKGTRVTVRTVLASLAEGGTIDEILHDFPSITKEQVRAIIAFAAASAEEDLPLPESWNKCFVVATDRKLRIRRPKE